jgi:hypothetical protein
MILFSKCWCKKMVRCAAEIKLGTTARLSAAFLVGSAVRTFSEISAVKPLVQENGPMRGGNKARDDGAKGVPNIAAATPPTLSKPWPSSAQIPEN